MHSLFIGENEMEFIGPSKNSRLGASFFKILIKLNLLSFLSKFQIYKRGPSPPHIKYESEKINFVNGNLLIKNFLIKVFFSPSRIIIFPLLVDNNIILS